MQRSRSSSRDVSSQPEESDTADMPEQHRPKKSGKGLERSIATIYDAAAGKVWVEQISREGAAERVDVHRRRGGYIKHSTRSMPMAPDEVLFRRKDAPERYEEYDVYSAHVRNLPRGGRGVLPESDLLKAVHTYTSKFYGAQAREQKKRPAWREVDERSMDETALLAFGILLEEAGREALGRRGDLVFTEGEGANSDTERENGSDDGARPAAAVGHQKLGSTRQLRPRGPKRQKLVESTERD